MPDEARMAVERGALALLDEVLDLPESARAAWIAERTADAAVKERLAAMLEADRISSLRTGAALSGWSDRPLPTRFGHYRVTGLIGRGGMGAVYRCVRDSGDFAHEVAIKVIKPGLLSDQLGERFRAERQTLATLAHPNIARLFDGGATEDGSPFIVMELVDGVAIDRWAQGRGLGRDGRLALLETVADAVAHAHARLVVHRDITPLNVLVTREGTVKLIDFGIARPSDGGTTTATDIAGLGRLTRRLFPAPGPELAAIIDRATAADEAARYPTVQAFAADLAALRTGHPVAAMAGGRGYRWRKYLARHRRSVAAAATAAVLLFGALAAVFVANTRAEAARLQAAQRFERTRDIAKALLFPAYDAVSRVAGSTEARRLLAATALPYLGELAAMRGAPPAVTAEAARGYVRLAEVTGSGLSQSLGRDADANVLLARAEGLLVPLRRAYPNDPAVIEAYAALRLEQAATDLYNNNNARRGRARAAEVEALLAPLPRDSAATVRNLAAAIVTQGDSFGWQDDYAAALPRHQRAEALITALPAALASTPDVLAVRSTNLRLLAEAHHKLGHAPEARAANDAAIATNRRLVALAPGDPAYPRKLAQSLWYAAVVYRTSNRDAEARAAITEAEAIAGALAARDPADMGALKLHAVIGEVLSQVLADAKDARGSIAMSDAVIAMHRRLVAAAGNTPGALRSMTSAMRTSGGNRYNLGDVAGACTLWQQVLANYRTLDRRGALTDYDRKNGVPEHEGYLRDICTGGKRPAEI